MDQRAEGDLADANCLSVSGIAASGRDSRRAASNSESARSHSAHERSRRGHKTSLKPKVSAEVPSLLRA